MASLTIKGIPPSLLDQLRNRAELHRRSLNSEVLHLLESATGSARVDPHAVLARIRLLQDRVPLHPLNEDVLEQAVGEGRP